MRALGSSFIDRLISLSESDRHWAITVVVLTRHWIHYGMLAFTLLVTLAAAAEGIFQP